ncbi:SDR family oxidoreductase [Acidisoma cellulosilytica]|uniref:SDR family oxidoreductase n=1 Tax=Acidisoma cellulosilyticum TaxID=2802395 RepID=A0A963Z6J9_9PROT|nr:SDR family oxidoreductase [Acidisoma cellulosilyticum]MCB8882792.1 SDR family oxidoreductase [Acidisoma cellulosilyticum]
MTRSIGDKVVAITGASSGIGEATARRLAQSGAKVVLGARRTDRLDRIVSEIKAAGGDAVACTLDVTQRSSVYAFVEAAVATFGRLDVFINNAGVMLVSPLGEFKVDEWDQMFDVNVKGVLNGIAAALPVMQRQEDGHIINLSSVAGHKVAPGFTVYCGTKFAVGAISEGLRQEAGPGIRCTVISPGAVQTELSSHIAAGAAKDAVDAMYATAALSPDAIAQAVVYAVSQSADVDVNEILIRPTAQNFF